MYIRILLHFVPKSNKQWSWSYGSLIYNYLYNQCLSPLKLWGWTPFMASEVYSIQHYVIKIVSDLRQIGGFLRFPPPINWPPRYNWNIVESGIKYHIPHNQTNNILYILRFHLSFFTYKSCFKSYVPVYIWHIAISNKSLTLFLHVTNVTILL